MNPRPDLAELHALVQKWRSGHEDELASDYFHRQNLADELAAALRKIEQDSATGRKFNGPGHLEETGYIPAGSAAEREQDSAATGAQGEAVCEFWIDPSRGKVDAKIWTGAVLYNEPHPDCMHVRQVTAPAPRGVTDAMVMAGLGVVVHWKNGDAANVAACLPYAATESREQIMRRILEAALSASTGEQREGKG